MFDIEFLSDSPELADDEQPDAMVLRGRTTIGDFREIFLAPWASGVAKTTNASG